VSNSDPKKPWSFFNLFFIERKADFIAITALFLSLLNFVIAVKWLSDTAELKMIAPLEIVIFGVSYFEDRKPILKVSASPSYLNIGNDGNSLIVTKESLIISVPGREDILLRGSEWTQINQVKKSLYISDSLSKAAVPFSVDGKSSVSNQTLYSPVPVIVKNGSETKILDRNYVYMEDFSNDLSIAFRQKAIELGINGAADHIEVNFEFEATDSEGATRSATCKVNMTTNYVLWLIDESREIYSIIGDREIESGSGWITADCVPVVSTSIKVGRVKRIR
jgi:hypothetical protein